MLQRPNPSEGEHDAQHGSRSLHWHGTVGGGGSSSAAHLGPPPQLSVPSQAPQSKGDGDDGSWQHSWALNPWDPQAQLSLPHELAPRKWQRPSLLNPTLTRQPRVFLQSSAYDGESASNPSWLQPFKSRCAGSIPASSSAGRKGSRIVASGGGRSRSRPARAANGRFMSKTKTDGSNRTGGAATNVGKGDGGCGNGGGFGSDSVADHCFPPSFLLVGSGLKSHHHTTYRFQCELRCLDSSHFIFSCFNLQIVQSASYFVMKNVLHKINSKNECLRHCLRM